MIIILYAFNVHGKMLLFSGEISPKDYESIEIIASHVFITRNDLSSDQITNDLKEALKKTGYYLTPVKIEKVFRCNKQSGFKK